MSEPLRVVAGLVVPPLIGGLIGLLGAIVDCSPSATRAVSGAPARGDK